MKCDVCGIPASWRLFVQHRFRVTPLLIAKTCSDHLVDRMLEEQAKPTGGAIKSWTVFPIAP